MLTCCLCCQTLYLQVREIKQNNNNGKPSLLLGSLLFFYIAEVLQIAAFKPFLPVLSGARENDNRELGLYK